jgi:predicted nuclease with TOPRIM domain
MNESEKLATELIKVSDKLMKLQVEKSEYEHRYRKMSKQFFELLEHTLELRDRFGYVDHSDWKYGILEKAGLLDDYE